MEVALSPYNDRLTWPLASVTPVAGSMLPNSDTSASAMGAPSLPSTVITAVKAGPLCGTKLLTKLGWNCASIIPRYWSRSTTSRPCPCRCKSPAFCSVMRATSTPWPPPMPSAIRPTILRGPTVSRMSMSGLLRRACSTDCSDKGEKPMGAKPSCTRGAIRNCFLRSPTARAPRRPVAAGSLAAGPFPFGWPPLAAPG